MKEYRVVYTVNGEGYSKDEAWIDTITSDKDFALEQFEMLREFNQRNFTFSEEWIESREITEWTLVDPSDLA